MINKLEKGHSDQDDKKWRPLGNSNPRLPRERGSTSISNRAHLCVLSTQYLKTKLLKLELTFLCVYCHIIRHFIAFFDLHSGRIRGKAENE